jgi:hypothetical protein
MKFCLSQKYFLIRLHAYAQAKQRRSRSLSTRARINPTHTTVPLPYLRAHRSRTGPTRIDFYLMDIANF